MMEVVAVCISEKKGERKHPVSEITLRCGQGIVGDGKQCHNDCAIKKTTGRCVMPTDGVFAVVLEAGAVRPGDKIEILEAGR